MREYELVAGLETHVELATATKIFCGCTTRFGAEPNTNCCPICIGLPGTLPKLNRRVIEYAVKAGLVTGCTVNEISKMDRKNYVYPDLPKAYQISQYDKPLCEHGAVPLSDGRVIGITRIHIEEDAGKLVHSRGDTLVDYNRGGVPLIEIVTEPDFRSVEEILEYLQDLQKMMRYIGVSDCRMQEGSLRCDVNISVRPKGESALGTRTEIKNMNSFAFIEKAVRYETERQIDILESGGEVEQETRRYDDAADITESMRGKEDANDYRYFREPDLVTIRTSPEQVEAWRAQIPELPRARAARYVAQFGLSEKDADLLTAHRQIADFFERAAEGVTARTVANFILGPVFRRLVTEADKESGEIPLSAENLNALVRLMDEGRLSGNLAKSTLEAVMDTGKSPLELLTADDLAGIDEAALRRCCEQAIAESPAAAADVRAGKVKALGALVGAVMRKTGGRADARKARELLSQLLSQ